jgi:serine/threonine-protein kinase
MKHCPICSTEYTDEHATCPTDSARLIETKEWQPGQVVANKYRVSAKIGRGGMGTVYRVFHIALEERRALKLINQQYAQDPKFIARFRNEARVARRLLHPNAVHVDDLDQDDDGNLFIAMEFVEGVSLRELISAPRMPLPLARALRITRCVADALGAAHALGIVHRDIKPDNILLGRDSSGLDIPKVADFGLVAMREGSAIVSSQLLLTPAYAPPEQWQGMKASELDGRTDIYALGVTLYEMLAARLPFDAAPRGGWERAHLEQIPLPPSTYNLELKGKADVDNLVLRMLAKDREMRPADANALIRELSLIEAQHTWVKETIVHSLPPVDQRFPVSPRSPTPPAAPQVEREVEIPMPPARAARPGEPTGRPGPRSGMKIAMGVAAGLLAVAGIMFPVIRMMSKQPPEIVSFDADPKTVESGKPVHLSWELTRVTKFHIEPQGGDYTARVDDNVVNGATVTPKQDTTYTLRATGPGGDKEAHVSVSVVSGAPAARAGRPTTPATPQPSVSAGASSGSSPRTAATAQPAVSGGAPLSSVAAAPVVDACAGKPSCYSGGPFVMEVTGVKSSQITSVNPSVQVLQVNVRFRNLMSQPIILAYVAGSGVVTDNNGKRYGDHYWPAVLNAGAKGIGTVKGDQADPQFVLGPNASGNASFVLARDRVLNNPRDPIGTAFNFDLSIAQLEVLPSQQVRTLRDYSVGFTELGAGSH